MKSLLTGITIMVLPLAFWAYVAYEATKGRFWAQFLATSALTTVALLATAALGSMALKFWKAFRATA